MTPNTPQAMRETPDELRSLRNRLREKGYPHNIDAEIITAALAQIETLNKTIALYRKEYEDTQLSNAAWDAKYDQLESELAAAKRDGERLDWLEKCCRINEYDGHDMPYSMVRIFTKPNEYWKCGHVDAIGIIKLRTAIDAARSTGSKP